MKLSIVKIIYFIVLAKYMNIATFTENLYIGKLWSGADSGLQSGTHN